MTTSIAANFYALIQAVQTNTLTAEQQAYLTALLEDEMQTEVEAAALFGSH
jgi:uncharacterized protein YggL (DUF469 family)